jgi:hypothetical protein
MSKWASGAKRILILEIFFLTFGFVYVYKEGSGGGFKSFLPHEIRREWYCSLVKR